MGGSDYEGRQRVLHIHRRLLGGEMKRDPTRGAWVDVLVRGWVGEWVFGLDDWMNMALVSSG